MHIDSLIKNQQRRGRSLYAVSAAAASRWWYTSGSRIWRRNFISLHYTSLLMRFVPSLPLPPRLLLFLPASWSSGTVSSLLYTAKEQQGSWNSMHLKSLISCNRTGIQIDRRLLLLRLSAIHPVVFLLLALVIPVFGSVYYIFSSHCTLKLWRYNYLEIIANRANI